MKIEKTELVRFEVSKDSVSLWIMIENSNPYYFVEFNGEEIGSRNDSFKRTVSIYRNLRKVIRMQNNILYCAYCDDYIVGTKEYQLSEGYKESLCPKCFIRAEKEYKTVTEVS